ncbi:MAG: exodeoxyribonuclease V subunit beta [Pseudomonadota bacterium]
MSKTPLQPLALERVPLEGINLIEASAGTGKTWTIVALYVRLLLERRIPAERILVVTFTKAATGELKSRVLERLTALRDALAGDIEAMRTSDDPLLRHVAHSSRDPASDAQWLTAAIESLDLAPIHTIHAFCHRALGEEAFHCGLPFDSELLADDTALLELAVNDCWRRAMAEAEPLWALWLQAHKVEPATLLAVVQELRNKPGAEHLLPQAPPRDAEARYAACYARARALWREAADEAFEALERSLVNRKSFTRSNTARWRESIDACLAPAAPHLALDECMERFTAEALAQHCKTGVPHPLFEALDALWHDARALEGAFAARYAHWCVQTYHEVMRAVGAHKRKRRVRAYDDLLRELHAALHGPQGEALAARLRQRYAAALIDEFQDTDPVQYDIFRAIYAGSGQPLYFVGDPKQAIYAFRGADVYAYLAAADDADAGYTLGVNHRSSSALVRAVNLLFERNGNAFLFERIRYRAVEAAGRADGRWADEGGGVAPLQFRFLPAGDKALNKTTVAERVAESAAAEIATLLQRARRGEVRVDGRPLSGGDIAVLVNTHRQADLVKEALAAFGVASVTYGQDSVYHSAEAEEYAQVLAAVAEPSHEGLVRAALATEMLGFTAEDIEALNRSDAEWDATLERFVHYHRLAVEHGFMYMWRELMRREEVPQRLLALPGGERRMTNVLHLADLLHEAATADGLDLEGLLHLLVRARTSAVGDPEAQQLRLESDQHLVRVLTVHASKGLEFPVVYCPYLWHGKRYAADAERLVFHRDGRVCVDFGSEAMDEHRALAMREEWGERLRLAYVALTRAKYRCVVYWGAVRDACYSALAWLLYGDARETAQDFVERFRKLKSADLLAPLQALAERSEGALSVTVLGETAEEAEPLERENPTAGTVEARAFSGAVPAPWRVSSFSGLVSREERESPDYDASTVVRRLAAPDGVREDMFGLPGGVRTGTLIHALFERIDFRSAAGPEVEALVARTLREHAYDPRWQPALVRMLADVVATPLDANGLRLERIAPQQRLAEMAFVFPVGQISIAALREACESLRETGSRLPDAVGRLVLAPARGFVKGYVDLVFEFEGRYYIADYKSNWLGERYEDYALPQLAAAMSESFYDLQYLLYTVALHRYLELRLPDYDYERHFGGVYYLFVRGMKPERGPASGVYATRPARALVERLDALFTREAGCV